MKDSHHYNLVLLTKQPTSWHHNSSTHTHTHIFNLTILL